MWGLDCWQGGAREISKFEIICRCIYNGLPKHLQRIWGDRKLNSWSSSVLAACEYMCSMCIHGRSCNAWHVFMHAWLILIYILYIYIHCSSLKAQVDQPVFQCPGSLMISNRSDTIELSYLSVVFLLTAGLPPVLLLVCHSSNCSNGFKSFQTCPANVINLMACGSSFEHLRIHALDYTHQVSTSPAVRLRVTRLKDGRLPL